MPTHAGITAVPRGNDTTSTANNRYERLNIVWLKRSVEAYVHLPHSHQAKEVTIATRTIELRRRRQSFVLRALLGTHPLGTGSAGSRDGEKTWSNSICI